MENGQTTSMTKIAGRSEDLPNGDVKITWTELRGLSLGNNTLWTTTAHVKAVVTGKFLVGERHSADKVQNLGGRQAGGVAVTLQ